ncbi:MAG: SAM-dependent methyltransferase, partial [Flavobacteriales bacterium CG_4_10_14_0_2_um_filter_35_18]
NIQTQLTSNFNLKVITNPLEKFEALNQFDLIYFDAFGPDIQPELWTEIIFTKMFKALNPNGILTTYSAKGSVRRTLQNVGFKVERLPGPPGKREMLRATKP